MSALELELVRADPAGNITLLVLTPAPADRRAEIARALLERCGGEQVGFLAPPALGGACRLEMMGGEFCGNALRALGRWWAEGHPEAADAPLPLEISGCDHPLPVRVTLPAGSVRAEMPLPEYLSEWEGFPVAVLPGIVHALCPDAASAEEHARRLTAALCARYGVPAAGVMYLSEDRRSLRPAVYVRDTDTLYFESSCASGSAAAAALLSRGMPEGGAAYALRQPGGVIVASARRQGGQLRSLAISGPVTVGRPFSVTLSLP